jgi:hypothetical protein
MRIRIRNPAKRQRAKKEDAKTVFPLSLIFNEAKHSLEETNIS